MQQHSAFAQIMSVISANTAWSRSEIEAFTKLLTVKKYKKGAYLLQISQICNQLYFINDGFCSLGINENGREMVSHFCKQNEFITDVIGFLSETPVPSTIFCKALQPTEAVIVPHAAMCWLYAHKADGDRIGRALYNDCALLKIQDMYDTYIPTPLERYKKLILKFPDIGQRVSQRVIASYLNITPVYFSILTNKK